jgi:hypothetical protein
MMTLNLNRVVKGDRYRPPSPEYLSIMLLALAWDVGVVCLKVGEIVRLPNLSIFAALYI